MQAIQKFSDFQSAHESNLKAVKEADLQQEYAEVFTSLLKKYEVSSPAELDDEKKKAFFDEISDYYKKGEGQTAKGEELVKDEDGKAPVKEEEEEEPKKEEEIEEKDLEGEEIEKEEDEDTAEEIEKEKVEAGEPKSAEGEDDKVEKQPEEPAAAPEATEDDPEAGEEIEKEEDKETAAEIETDKVEMGKPRKAIMSFDEFIANKNESASGDAEEWKEEDKDLEDAATI
jgi:hypothetical protein